jgi:hypothetical protein
MIFKIAWLAASLLVSIFATEGYADRCSGAKLRALAKYEIATFSCATQPSASKRRARCQAKALRTLQNTFDRAGTCGGSAADCVPSADTCERGIAASFGGTGACRASALRAAQKFLKAHLACYARAAAHNAPLNNQCTPQAQATFVSTMRKTAHKGCNASMLSYDSMQSQTQLFCVENLIRASSAGAIGSVCDSQDGLSDDILRALESTPDDINSPSETILPNGISLADYLSARGISIGDADAAGRHTARAPSIPRAVTLPLATDPDQRKQDIIAAMLTVANDPKVGFTCGRQKPVPCSKWTFVADAADPKTSPAQTGLTYVWNGKNPYARTLTADGCTEKTFGMDCSGLVYQLALAAGISLPTGTSLEQSVPSNWGLPTDWGLEMKAVEGPIESGDILAWSGHIGIADVGPKVTVISSTGHLGECTANITPPRGPRSLTIPGLKRGEPNVILRLTVSTTPPDKTPPSKTPPSTTPPIPTTTSSSTTTTTVAACTMQGTDFCGPHCYCDPVVGAEFGSIDGCVCVLNDIAGIGGSCCPGGCNGLLDCVGVQGAGCLFVDRPAGPGSRQVLCGVEPVVCLQGTIACESNTCLCH